MRRSIRSLMIPLVAVVALLMTVDQAMACAVCFGDPDSAMAKGAVAGVLVLVGVVTFVLAGMVGTGLFWVHRSRRIDRDGLDASADDAADQGP